MECVPVAAALGASVICFALGTSVGVSGVCGRWESAAPTSSSSGPSFPGLALIQSSSRISPPSPSQAITAPLHSAVSRAPTPARGPSSRETTRSQRPTPKEGSGATSIRVEATLELGEYRGRRAAKRLVDYWVDRGKPDRARALIGRVIAQIPATLEPYTWLLELNSRAGGIRILRAIDLGQLQLLEVVSALFGTDYPTRGTGQHLRQEPANLKAGVTSSVEAGGVHRVRKEAHGSEKQCRPFSPLWSDPEGYRPLIWR